MNNTLSVDNKDIKKPRRSFTYKKQKLMWALIFLAPWFLGLCFFFAFPFFQSIWNSFFELSPSSEGITSTFVGLANYRFALFEHTTDTNATFNSEIINTIIDLFVNIPIMVIFALFISTLLNTEFKGRAIVRCIFFIPVILNSAAVTSVLASSGAAADNIFNNGVVRNAFNMQEFLTNAGLPKFLINGIVTLIGRIYSIITLAGVPILLFLASIQSIPKHLYEAAKIEGATNYEMFWLITLPNVKPHIITVGIFGIIDTYLTSSVSGLIADEFRSKENGWGRSSAMAWLYVLTIVGVLLVYGVFAKATKLGESHYE